MKEFDIAGVPLSKWTNAMLEKCERLKGDELYEDEIISILDYMVGFVDLEDEDADYIGQALDYLGIETEDELDEDDEDDDEDLY